MKCFNCLFIILFAGLFHQKVSAQTRDDALALVKEGVVLNGSGKYAEAIEKYNQALKIDTGYLFADYQMALSLFNSDKGTDGIAYLKKVTAANNSLTPAATDLLSKIYEKGHLVDKAIETYKDAIKVNPTYQIQYYNLGLIYFRNRQYADAEQCAIQAIKLDPKHAGSQRMYALVCFHQNKRANALLGFCSFILLEPNTARSAEAYGNIQHILTGGTLKAEPGVPVPVPDANTISFNQVITQAIAEAGKEKHASAADRLAAQLSAIFTKMRPLADKLAADDFFTKYYADYFYKLAQSANMPAFARLVSGSTPESAQWIKDHPEKMLDLENWVKETARNF